MTLRHKTRFNTSGQGFKKDPIRYQCYLTKGDGQGVPKRKFRLSAHGHKTELNQKARPKFTSPPLPVLSTDTWGQ